MGVSARMMECGLRGWWLVLVLAVAGCPEEAVSDVGEAYDPAAPMASGGEAEVEAADAAGCDSEPWSYLPSDAFRIRVEAPDDGAFVEPVREFLAELGGEELIASDASVVGNAFRVDALQVEAGDADDPGAVVAVLRDGAVEVSAFGTFEAEGAVCSRVAPEGFLVTSMPFPPQEGLDPRGPTPLTSTWMARIEGGVVTLRNAIAMRPGHEPLDVEQERDKLGRQMLEWFPNELPELEVTLDSNVLTLLLTADTEPEVEALLDLLSKMVPQVRLSTPPVAE